MTRSSSGDGSRAGGPRSHAVTVIAPLDPNTVNCSSTSTPMTVVIAQPSAQSAASASGQSIASRPARRPSASACAAPTAAPQIAPCTTSEVTSVRKSTSGRADGQTEREPECGGRDPDPGGGSASAHAPRLRGAEHRTTDGATDESGRGGVDRAGDDLRRNRAEREAGERGHPAADHTGRGSRGGVRTNSGLHQDSFLL